MDLLSAIEKRVEEYRDGFVEQLKRGMNVNDFIAYKAVVAQIDSLDWVLSEIVTIRKKQERESD